MPVIHMEVEQVRELSLSLNQRLAELEEAQSELNRSAGRLSVYWQGGAANRFCSELKRCSLSLEEKINQLQELTTRLNREADEWVQADSNGMGRMQSSTGLAGLGGGGAAAKEILFSTLPVIPTGAALGGAAMAAPWVMNMSSALTQNLQGFDWGKWGFDFTKNAVKMENTILKEMTGAGSFGNYVGAGVGGVFDFASGLMDGESLTQAGTSALISSGISLGVSFVAAPVLVINTGVHLLWGLSSLGMDAMGWHEDATFLRDLSTATDVSGYISDISDGVADVVLPPYDTPPDFSQVGERAEHFSYLFN